MLEVDSCPACRGMWLDANELDRLEDMAFDDDPRKGSLIHSKKRSGFPCPRCGTAMVEFQYRLYDLRLDYCEAQGHGFWLEAGEDQRVLGLMHQRAAQIQRKLEAEAEWQEILRNMHAFLKKRVK
jgi:Zn-finger nucleic acid-binding protein